MTLPATRALDVLDAVVTAPSRDAAWSAFVGLVAPSVGPNLSYTFGGRRRPASAAKVPSRPVVLVTPRLEPWKQAYFGDPLLREHDPVRRALCGTIAPIDWAALEGRPDAPEPERRLWRYMHEVGFEGGLSLPLHEPGTGRYGALSVHFSREDGGAVPEGAQLAGLQAAAMHFHGGFRARFDGAEGADVDLSRREREVLHWVAGGLTSKAIARRIGLSPYTVDMHIAQAMRKLGARTRSEAAGLALMQGRIAP